MGCSNVGDVYPVIRSGGNTVEGNPTTAGSEMDEDIGKPSVLRHWACRGYI